MRLAIIILWAVPLHQRGYEYRPSQSACVNQPFEPDQIRRQAILKEDTEFHSSSFAFSDERICPRGCNVNRLFDEDVETTTCSRDALFCCNPEGLPIATMSIGLCSRKASKSSYTTPP